MRNLLVIIGPFLALLRHFAAPAVIDAIKTAAVFALSQTEWGEGQRTQFVIDSAMKVAAATPNPYDDLFVQLGATLYLKKYLAKNALISEGVDSSAVAAT